MRRHAVPTRCRFAWVLSLTYALPRRVLAGLLPPGLELETRGELGFLGVTVVRTTALRPAFLPGLMGREYLLASHRVFARLSVPRGDVLRGLSTLRCDTDSAWLVRWGNRMTRFGYRPAKIDCTANDESLRIRVATSDAGADLDVEVDTAEAPGRLPDGSPLVDAADARELAAPLENIFEYEPESDSMIVVAATRGDWGPRPVRVDVHANSLLAATPFRGQGALLACAFFGRNVDYGWRRGVRRPVARP
ncbi:MAG: hypothetical protein GY716_18525 [bacterium]|nr:hypothetical protein [bacterium]